MSHVGAIWNPLKGLLGSILGVLTRARIEATLQSVGVKCFCRRCFRIGVWGDTMVRQLAHDGAYVSFVLGALYDFSRCLTSSGVWACLKET